MPSIQVEPYNNVPPTNIYFSISYDDVEIESYLWDFGDGETSDVGYPNHRYMNAGTYTVSCTVKPKDENSFVLNYTIKLNENSVGSDIKNCSFTNKSYRFSLQSSQGVNFSENTGSAWIYPKTKVGTLRIKDKFNINHNLVFDSITGRFYDIELNDAPAGSYSYKLYQDRCNIDGISGVDISPYVKFKEDTGEYEKYFLRGMGFNLYTRPSKETNRNIAGYDSNGYPNELTIDVETFKDGNPTTSSATSSDITLPRNEIHFDTEVSNCNRIQRSVSANKADFRIYGRQENLIVYDKSTDPNSKKSKEDTWQETLSDCYVWVTRGENLLYDRVSKTELTITTNTDIPVLTYTKITGPDNNSESALRSSYDAYSPSRIILPSFTTDGDFALVFWCGSNSNAGIKTNVDNAGFVNLPVSSMSAVNGFYLRYLNVTASAGMHSIVITNSNTSYNIDLFDIRVVSGTLTQDELNYIHKDINSNTGNNLLPLF